MTVYELIQELARFEPDADVQVEICMNEYEADCDKCGEYTSVPGDTYTVEIDEVDNAYNDKYQIRLKCEY